MTDEKTKYLEFLCDKVAAKRCGVDTNPTFEGDKIRASFVMVGRPGVRASPEPYMEWVDNCIRNRIKTVYILACGPVNVALARTLLERLHEQKKVGKAEEYECYRTRFGKRILALRAMCELRWEGQQDGFVSPGDQ
jgi:hypothetical protein